MILHTYFTYRGIEFDLFLDSDKCDRNYDDENYAEWFILHEESGYMLDVTVWQDALGRPTPDGTVEIYKDEGCFEDGLVLTKRGIKVYY